MRAAAAAHGRRRRPHDRLRVTVVTPFGVLGGAERWLLAVLGATRRLDVDVILLGDGPLRARLTGLGIPTRVVQTGARGRDLVAATVDVARLLRADRPEVVLANGVKAAAVALPASWAAGTAALWVKHDLSFDRLLAWPLGRIADGVIAVSARAGAAVRREDVTVLAPPRPSSTPAGRTEAQKFWSDRGVALTRPTVAMATRLLPYKGVDDMIRALARGPGARSWDLVVIGSDDYAAPGETRRLTMLARQLGVADRVRFAGAVEDAGRWLAAFDAVAVLTRRDGLRHGGEGYSLTALEAAIAGVQLIATTDVPAVRELAASAVVAPRDHDAIARALTAIGTSPSASSTDSARHQIDDHPDAATVADTVVARLAGAAGRPGAGLAAEAPMSVVTTVLNERDEIARLCDALTPQLRANDELLLVDGGSTDGTLDVFRALADSDPRLRLIEAPGSNIAAGRNVGIAEARHAAVAFTDAGCVPADGWLDALRAGFAESDVPAVVTGVYRVRARTAMEHAVAASCYPQLGELRRRGPLVRVYGRLLGSTFDATTPTGRSMAGARGALMAAGGFDEALATAEDVTVGRDIARDGGRCVLAADAEVAWWQRPTMRAQTRMWYAYGHGDGRSRDRLLIARNAYRAAAYAIGAGLIGRRRARAVVAVAAAAYMSLPAVRVLRDGRPLPSVLLVPVALATKDLAKVVGCAHGLWQQAAADRRPLRTPSVRDRRAPRPRRRAGGDPRGAAAGAAVLLPEIGLDGRSRVVASVIAILNERGVTPDLVTFSDVRPPTALDRFIDTPLRYTVRRVDRPFIARGAMLSDLALSRTARRLPPYAGYVMLNTPDIGFGPDAFVLRYITFPTERIREFEERYTHQPYWSFGALLSAVFRRARRHRTPQGRWLANSAFVRSLVIETYDLAPGDVDVLYGPVTLPREPVRRDRDRLVVSVGGFHSDKRQLEQIEIASMLPDVSFVIIGSVRSPRYLQRCRRRAASLPNVTLMTDATRADMDAVVSRAMVFLHTKHYEHQGLSTVEGIGRGCVPVVHDSGGQREVVPDARLRFATAAEAAAIIETALDGAFDERLPALRRHAEAFGEAAFHESLAPYVDQLVAHARAVGRERPQAAAEVTGGGGDGSWPVGSRWRG